MLQFNRAIDVGAPLLLILKPDMTIVVIYLALDAHAGFRPIMSESVELSAAVD